LILDPATASCTRAGRAIPLTRREFALLDALMRREGTVVAKLDLLCEVWGDDADCDPNIVEVYIGYLRKKIDRGEPDAMIRTVRGIGYRLVCDA
jgi:DNA-binding response OmpR family regulator